MSQADKSSVIKTSIENYASDQPAEVKTAIEGLTKKIYEDGVTPKDAMGLSDQMVEGIYGYGYRLYNTGKYEQASQLFRLLIMLDPTKMKHMMGLAACYHMLKDYSNAALTYTLCSFIDPSNPLPYYHASDCYLQSGSVELTKRALQACIASASAIPELNSVKERAQIMLDNLEKGIMPTGEEILHELEKTQKQQEKK